MTRPISNCGCLACRARCDPQPYYRQEPSFPGDFGSPIPGLQSLDFAPPPETYNAPKPLFVSRDDLYAQSNGGTMAANSSISGNKPIVISEGYSPAQFDTIEEAQAEAESRAQRTQGDVYILKPVKKVSPKREVTVTELT